MQGSRRTQGTDLLDAQVYACFDDTVPMARCLPGELFKISKITKSGKSSDWPACKRWYPTMTSLVEHGQDRIPKQRLLHVQLKRWLASKNIDWTTKDTERSTYHLRLMLMSLLDLKRHTGKAPKTMICYNRSWTS